MRMQGNVQAARVDDYQEKTGIHERNVNAIMRNHDKSLNQIKRSGARLRILTCPPIALIFGAAAWYCFSQGVVIMGIAYGLAALAFLAMLIYGAIYDRPTNM